MAMGAFSGSVCFRFSIHFSSLQEKPEISAVMEAVPGRELGAERIGIRFKKDLVILCGDGKFIKLASSKARYEGFIDAGILQRLHGRRLWIPAVEVSNDAHRLRMGRPDGKVHTRLSAIGAGMGSQLFKDLIVGTLTEQVAVQFCNEAGYRPVFRSFLMWFYCFFLNFSYSYASRSLKIAPPDGGRVTESLPFSTGMKEPPRPEGL